MNETMQKVCGICGVEINFTRRELQKIQQLLRQELIKLEMGDYAPHDTVLGLFNGIAHRVHTERDSK